MSFISKEHFSMALKSIKKLLSGKADKSEVEGIKQYVDSSQKQSDWSQNDSTAKDHVKNRTHYESNEVVFQHIFTDADVGHQISHSFTFEIGETYIVEMDGIEYECTAYAEYGSGYATIQCVAHDNKRFMMYSANTDAPYVIVHEPCTVVITAPVVHKLDEKYIPDTIARTNDVADVNNDIADLAQRAGVVYYGVCSTAAATSAKLVRLQHSDKNFKLKTGVIVSVKFTYSNTNSMTLNVDSTGAKPIRVLNNTLIDLNYWRPNSYVTFLYDGSYWNIIFMGSGDASTSYHGLVNLSDSVSSTVNAGTAATPRAVKSAYDLANAALPKSGGTMTGNLTLKGDPTSNLHAATKQYVDNAVNSAPEQVQSDWNQMNETATDYIKNKTHYAIGGEVILEEQTFTSVAVDVDIHPTNPEYMADTATDIGIPASVGDLYDVYFNGVMYSCTVKSNYVFNCIGNESFCAEFANKENTGEPFLVSLSKKIRVYTAEPMEFTIKIVKHEFFKPLDEKFIPDTIARTEDIDLSPYALKTEIPSIESLATEEYVDKAIASMPDYYDFVETIYFSAMKQSIADYCEKMSYPQYKMDLQLANTIPSVLYPSETALAVFAINLRVVLGTSILEAQTEAVITEFENMKANGVFSSEAIMVALGSGGEVAYKAFVERGYTGDFTHRISLQWSDSGYKGDIHWNHSTKTIYSHSIKMAHIDETLTRSEKCADAKAVGNRFTELENSIEGLATVEYVDNAVSNVSGGSGEEVWKTQTYDFSADSAVSIKLELPSQNIKEAVLTINARNAGTTSNGKSNWRIYADVEATSGNADKLYCSSGIDIYTTDRTARVYYKALGDSQVQALTNDFNSNGLREVMYPTHRAKDYLYLVALTSGALLTGTATLYYRE